MGGLGRFVRDPRGNVRARRNTAQLAATFDELLGDGFVLSEGVITLVSQYPIFVDTLGIGLNYGTGLQLDVDTLKTKDSEIVHDNLSGFVANEHINHTAVTLTAGTGLSGGGDISANRTFDLSHLGIEALTNPAADRLLFWDETTNAIVWLEPIGNGLTVSDTSIYWSWLNMESLSTTPADKSFMVFTGATGGMEWGAISTGLQFTGTTLSTKDSEIVHDNLSGFVANEHIDHTGVTLTAGDGLTGGGDISSSRTFAVDYTTGLQIVGDQLATNDSQIVHDSLSGVHQDVNTTATPVFAQVTVDNLVLNNNRLSPSAGVLELYPATGSFVRSLVDNNDANIPAQLWYIDSGVHCTADYGGGAKNNIALEYIATETVATGKTNTGFLVGMRASVYRSYDNYDGDGTLNNMYAGWMRYGHFNQSEAACVTTTVYGMYMLPVCWDGTIGTLYDLYIAAVQGTGTVTTHYGIYQVDSTAKNVLVGQTHFGAAAVPAEDVHAADTVRADVAFNLNGADGLTGTLDVEVGGTRVQLGFVGGILTSTATPAPSGTDAVSWS